MSKVFENGISQLNNRVDIKAVENNYPGFLNYIHNLDLSKCNNITKQKQFILKAN